MKKALLSFAAALIAASSVNSSAEPITTTPNGTLYDNIYRSSTQYLSLWGSLYVSQVEGKISDLVIDGNDFYMYQPVSNFAVSQGYWIKGTLQTDGKVVFPMPQELYVQPANQWTGTPETPIYGKMVKIVADGTYELDTENTDLVMSWKDNVLTQIVPEGYTAAPILGLCDDQGYTGSGEGNIQWSVFTEKPLTLPAGLETHKYVCTSVGQWETTRRIVEIATSGNDFWIKGLYGYFEDSCIHGTIDGDKVVIPSNQYLGIYTTEMYYYFFQAADVDTRFNEEWGEEESYNIPAASVTLTKEGDTYKADKSMLMTFGKYTANTGMPAGSNLQNVTFTPYDEQPATPADPVIIDLGEYWDPWGRTVTFNIPMTDTDGNYINPQNMYYNVYVNGQLYSLTHDIYNAITETITDIPYEFSMTGVVFTNGGEQHSLTLYIEEEPEFGVQSFYTVNGETRKSALITAGTSGIRDVTAASSASTEWYNLNGVRVINPSKGLFIRVDRLADGTVKTSKVALR